VAVRLEAPVVDLERMNRRMVHITQGMRARKRTKRALADEEVDVVHYHVSIAATGVFARRARRRHYGQPLIVHLWNAVYEADEVFAPIPWKQRAYHHVFNGRRAALMGLAGADAVVVSSRFQRGQLVRMGLRAPVHVVPNGVDTEAFRPADAVERNVARHELDVDGDPVVLYYGHLSAWKGVDVLADAMAMVVREHPKARLLVSHTTYGHGGQALRERLERLGIRDRCRLVAPTDPSTLHAAADVAVLPTMSSVGSALHPNVLLECMAAGLPTVASHVGSVAEAIEHERTGLLARPGDAASLADRILTLAQDAELSRRLGQQARQACLDELSWSSSAQKIEDLYRTLLHLPSSPAEPPVETAWVEVPQEAGR
jgi:glycosyltransferase involved in cell wall biosynthesis